MSETHTICKGCKTETAPNLFEKPENLKAVIEPLRELGFTADSTLIELIKQKTAGLCALCGEIEIVKTALLSVIVEETDGEETHKCILNLINRLIFLAEESIWIACKRSIYEEITSARLGSRVAWRLFMRLCNLRGQPQHVNGPEAELLLERYHTSSTPKWEGQQLLSFVFSS